MEIKFNTISQGIFIDNKLRRKGYWELERKLHIQFARKIHFQSDANWGQRKSTIIRIANDYEHVFTLTPIIDGREYLSV